jgi:hypothetical protein
MRGSKPGMAGGRQPDPPSTQPNKIVKNRSRKKDYIYPMG